MGTAALLLSCAKEKEWGKKADFISDVWNNKVFSIGEDFKWKFSIGVFWEEVTNYMFSNKSMDM